MGSCSFTSEAGKMHTGTNSPYRPHHHKRCVTHTKLEASQLEMLDYSSKYICAARMPRYSGNDVDISRER